MSKTIFSAMFHHLRSPLHPAYALCACLCSNCPQSQNLWLSQNCYAHIGLFTTDRDEQMSSLSRTGSGYSPSFFFKPIKYGVMGNTLASNTNTVNNTTIKHQAVASLGNGKLAICHCFRCFFVVVVAFSVRQTQNLMLFSLHTHLSHMLFYGSVVRVCLR